MTFSFLLSWLIIVLLHCPYHWECQWDARGRESGVLHAALFSYTYRPTYEQLSYHGLQRLQNWLLLLALTVAQHIQPDMLAAILTAVRQ